jgi:hypothetical protein
VSSTPWIYFHALWTSRLRDGLKVLGQLEQFLAACAFDLRITTAALEVFEDHGDAFARATRDVPSTPAELERALAAISYRPGPLVDAVRARLGDGKHGTWASGASGLCTRWRWEREAWRRSDPPIDAAPMLDAYRAHAAQPPIARGLGGKAIELRLGYEFEIKRPGEMAPLFPGTSLRSTASIALGGRRVSIAVRYDSPQLTPELADAHAAITAALAEANRGKLPRHAFQRITPARRPGARERAEDLEA